MVDTAPAAFSLYAAIPTLVVMGNCDNYGEIHWTSQKTGRREYPQIHAPVVQIQRASATLISAYRIDTGTSFCKQTETLEERVPLTFIPSYSTRSRRCSVAHGGWRNGNGTRPRVQFPGYDSWVETIEWWRTHGLGHGSLESGSTSLELSQCQPFQIHDQYVESGGRNFCRS